MENYNDRALDGNVHAIDVILWDTKHVRDPGCELGLRVSGLGFRVSGLGLRALWACTRSGLQTRFWVFKGLFRVFGTWAFDMNVIWFVLKA